LALSVDFAALAWLRGPVVLVPSLSPTIEVAEVSIANSPEFAEGDLASAGLLQ
jgi:hypothetical protein